jgi:hypothetical protein
MSYVKGVINEENKEYNLLIMAPESGTASIMIGDTSTVSSATGATVAPSNVQISYDTQKKDAYIDFTSSSESTLSFRMEKK